MAERMIEVVGYKDPMGEGLYNCGITDERIVRCRDCQYGYQHDGKRFPRGKRYKGLWYCIAWGDGMQGEWTKPNGYCHKAKPRLTERTDCKEDSAWNGKQKEKL